MTDDLPLWAVTHSRKHGEPTSLEAAVSMTLAAQVQRRLLYAALIDLGPLTADEADDKLEWRPSTAGRRMSDLVRLGFAEFTGETRKTRSGRRANVYRAITEQKRGAA